MTEQRLPILQLCRMSTWSTWSWSQRRRASRGGSNGRCEAAVGPEAEVQLREIPSLEPPFEQPLAIVANADNFPGTYLT